MPIEPRTYPILEKKTGSFRAQITDQDGVTPLPLATLATLTLTLYVIKGDGTISYVNGRNAQNVLNANNVVVSATGLITWTIQTADTTLVEALAFERHIALFQWTWGLGAGAREVVLVVQHVTTLS